MLMFQVAGVYTAHLNALPTHAIKTNGVSNDLLDASSKANTLIHKLRFYLEPSDNFLCVKESLAR
eukprot:5295068-Amphidinium_carterae.2